ncbi:MAG: hypothetical protein IOD15_07105 [Phycisphaerales bacterium]|jgi:hypothetical protein|nr:hypothetical protein [Phycisphaerales bacterium]
MPRPAAHPLAPTPSHAPAPIPIEHRLLTGGPIRTALALASGLVAAAAMWAVLAAVILSGATHARTQFDQDRFHLRVIADFSAALPAPNLADYPSATTPGFHLLLAAVHRWLTADTTTLRLLAALLPAAMLGLLVGWLAPRRGTLAALALALPLGCCMYVVQAGAYLLPDNAGWLGVLVVLLLALQGPPDRAAHGSGRWWGGWWGMGGWGGWYTLLGLALFLLVMCRQIHLWVLAPALVGAFFAGRVGLGDTRRADASLAAARFAWLIPVDGLTGGLRRVGVVLAAAVPAVAALTVLIITWRGLTPPGFRFAQAQAGDEDATSVTGLSPSTPAFILALLGVYGVFFLAWLWPRIQRNTVRWGLVLATMLAAAAVALAVPTDHFPRPRIGGLWNLARATEPLGLVVTWFGHRTSLLIVALAALGGAWLALWTQALPRRTALILLAALAGFVAAMTCQALSWQRYFEPLLLVWLALCAGCLPAQAAEAVQWAAPAGRWPLASVRTWQVVGPVVLGVVLAALTVGSFVGS